MGWSCTIREMPVINIDDLTDKDKALMEVNQLKTEIKLERWKLKRGLTSALEGLCISADLGGYVCFETEIWARISVYTTASIMDGNMKTSICCEEIRDYIQAQVDEDTLVKGIAEDKNPFKEKGGCILC